LGRRHYCGQCGQEVDVARGVALPHPDRDDNACRGAGVCADTMRRPPGDADLGVISGWPQKRPEKLAVCDGQGNHLDKGRGIGVGPSAGLPGLGRRR
jgi:hypothetical protein